MTAPGRAGVEGSARRGDDHEVHCADVAKKIALALLLVVLVVTGVLGWLWTRLTALPDWYENQALIAEDGTPQVDADWVIIPSAPDEPRRYQIRNPHLRPKAQTKAKPITQAIKGSRAVWADEGTKQALEAGAVINLSELDVSKLGPKDRKHYENAISAFPALMQRDVYVGIEGEVGRRGSALVVSPNTKLRVGETRYSLATVAKRMKVSEAELRRTIEKELAKLDLQAPEQR
jgi:hypothetical protein